MTIAAVVVAAGQGTRFGGPKQFSLFEGETVAARSVRATRTVATYVVLVVPDNYKGDGEGADLVVSGGSSRAASWSPSKRPRPFVATCSNARTRAEMKRATTPHSWKQLGLAWSWSPVSRTTSRSRTSVISNCSAFSRGVTRENRPGDRPSSSERVPRARTVARVGARPRRARSRRALRRRRRDPRPVRRAARRGEPR